jgi:hypothetical protein
MNPDHEVDHTRCAAHGCPMPGSVTSSTSGTQQWFCHFHLNCDVVSWNRISNELNRLGWLVAACSAIRAKQCSDDWPATYRKIQHEIRQHSRSDLLYNDKIDVGVRAWLHRLDSEIAKACNSKPQLALVKAAADTWQRVQHEVPESV